MSEIEKMYENAGIEPDINYVCDKEPCEKHSVDCQECSHLYDTREDYPDFTAEKQLELIKTIERKCDLIDCIQIVYRPMEDLWKISIMPVLEMAFEEMYLFFGCDKDFSTALAMAINNLWQDLTEEEKQQIKEILE